MAVAVHVSLWLDPRSASRPELRGWRIDQQKSRSRRRALKRFLGAASLPVGPSLDPRRRISRRRSASLFQELCQVTGAKKSTQYQRIRNLSPESGQIFLLMKFASLPNSCNFIVQCTKMGRC
jgi:hypothetical protein